MLKINNLKVEVEDKTILNNLDLNLEKGKVYVLMGPNGSGKSTLANVLMGNKKYDVSKGEIIYENEDLMDMPCDERAKKGIFLSFQYPQEISGVSLRTFLKTALESVSDKKIRFIEFDNLLDEKLKRLKIDKEFVQRYINENFSGGEKKKSEMLQMLVLNPKLVILDETDSGLDIDALKIISQAINSFKDKDKTILIITHYKRILDFIKPDVVFVMKKGKIVHQGDLRLVDELENKGYDVFD
jgi:Fe-S cluster assembly ATP-binding protein